MTVRTSHAVLALIADPPVPTEIWIDPNAKGTDLLTERQWLLRWNQKWRAYHFIGGHIEANETDSECLRRELIEELPGSIADACWIDLDHPREFRYRALSQSAGVPTDYRTVISPVTITEPGRKEIAKDDRLRWVNQFDLERGRVLGTDEAISQSVGELFARLGWMADIANSGETP